MPPFKFWLPLNSLGFKLRTGQSVLTQDYSEDVWKSVLRIQDDINGDAATALVFDVHVESNGKGFLYLLVNDHYTLQPEHKYLVRYFDRDGNCLEVDAFGANEFCVFKKSPKEEHDFVIYKLPLDPDTWEVGMGIAKRKEEQQPLAKKRRGTPRANKGAKQKVVAAQNVKIVCKTPRFWYEGIHPSDAVRVYALPASIGRRWQADTTITSVGRLCFFLRALSAPGGSGGAVVTTKTGDLIGYIAGAYDVEDVDKRGKKGEWRFNTYGFTVQALPRRLSSPPNSPAEL